MCLFIQINASLSLGPNGSIMTAMNLFATRIDQVIEFVEKRSEDNEYEGPISLVIL